MVLVVGVLTVLVGSILIRDLDQNDAIATPTVTDSVAAIPDGNPDTDDDESDPGEESGEANDPDSDDASIDASFDVHVKKPEYANFTENLTRVREHYSETYTYGTVTVGWRPGAFPPEHAAYVADTTARLLGAANAKLGTNFYPELYVYLADQLYTPECHGCQGFAAADLFQIFLLHDGSVADDEFEALLIHEITHVIAAHEISLPHSLFFAEGLATWVMADYLAESGYLSPLQTAAWMHRAGVMPGLQQLREDDFAGRVRKRAEYDGSASFAFFAIDTYGYESYLDLYRMDPPEHVVGKTWDELDAEWRAYLDQWADNTIDGVDAYQWWGAMSRVAEGFGTLYTDPEPVTQEQYRQLVISRLAVNRGDIASSLEAINASGLVTRTAQ